MKDALTRRALLRYILSENITHDVESAEDALRTVGATLAPIVEAEAPVFRELVVEIVNSLSLHTFSHQINLSEGIGKSLSKVSEPRRKATKKLLVLLDGVLSVRIPDIDMNNQGLIDNLASLLGLALELTGTDKKNLKILRDSDLGRHFTYAAKIQKNVDILRAAVKLPANMSGEAVQFEAGLKANLPEILAALRVARRNSGLTRTVNRSQGPKPAVTSAELLRRTFNTRFGFEEAGADSWVCNFLRALFAEVTKPDAPAFPGEWMHSLRKRNNTNSDVGILARWVMSRYMPRPSRLKR
jgi:hypothetical protein